MYNLTVDEAHTFFVGDGQWLVHNCGEAKAIYEVINSPYIDMANHVPGVQKVSVDIATRLGLPSGQIDIISRGAFLHDIGKNALPHIFNAPKSMKGNPFIWEHVYEGAKRLEDLGVDNRIRDIALYHHPSYPGMPPANMIPFNAKIVSAADIYSAATEIRVYRPYSKGRVTGLDWVTNDLLKPGYITQEIFDALKYVTK